MSLCGASPFEDRVVDVARADQAGAARPDRCGSDSCAIDERRHPKGRSEAKHPA
jgi:hypothetical protein